MKLLRSLSIVALRTGWCCGTVRAEEPRVLVYTRNHVTTGKGYVHDNIAASVAMIRQLPAINGFTVDVSDDPPVFTPKNLKKNFSDANFQRHVLGGILWVPGK